MPTPPSTPARRLTARLEPAVERALGDGRRKRVAQRAERLLPGRLRQIVDFEGWSASEYRAFTEIPGGTTMPPTRCGREAVARINALSGTMPIDAVLLSRAITDTAPPAGSEVNPTLADLLERYLPESLLAYENSSRRAGKDSAEELLLAQLRLLHSVALNLEQAQAEHNERDLQIQDRFLKERFANLTPGELELGPRFSAAPASIRSLEASAKARAKAAPAHGRAYLQADHEPVVLFRRENPSPWELQLRLALPKGQAAVLGVVEESTTGATLFTHRTGRRLFTQRRTTGFRAAQVDLSLPVKLASPRRVLIYAESLTGRSAVDTVLFVRSDAKSQAELATTLANHTRAPLTVIASAFETADGLIVRNESILFPDLRAACEAFGYRNITWLDRHSPVV